MVCPCLWVSRKLLDGGLTWLWFDVSAGRPHKHATCALCWEVLMSSSLKPGGQPDAPLQSFEEWENSRSCFWNRSIMPLRVAKW